MNEQLFASRIKKALDESSERLPYRVTQRLERARLAAVARARPDVLEGVVSTVPAVGGPGVALAGGDRPSGLVRLLSAAVPVLLVIGGLYGIALWDDAQRAAETADIDAALMLSDDELPIAAYADRGFGVYIKNSSRP